MLESMRALQELDKQTRVGHGQAERPAVRHHHAKSPRIRGGAQTTRRQHQSSQDVHRQISTPHSEINQENTV